jgi:hypothetical protein
MPNFGAFLRGICVRLMVLVVKWTVIGWTRDIFHILTS